MFVLVFLSNVFEKQTKASCKATVTGAISVSC